MGNGAPPKAAADVLRASDPEVATPGRVTVRLTAYQRRQLNRLRTAGLPPGARPRAAARVLVDAMLRAAAELDAT